MVSRKEYRADDAGQGGKITSGAVGTYTDGVIELVGNSYIQSLEFKMYLGRVFFSATLSVDHFSGNDF